MRLNAAVPAGRGPRAQAQRHAIERAIGPIWEANHVWLILVVVVLFVAFYGQLATEQILSIGATNYIYKFAIAVLITPLLYLVHRLIDNYLGKETAHRMVETAHRQGGILDGKPEKEA